MSEAIRLDGFSLLQHAGNANLSQRGTRLWLELLTRYKTPFA